jgi:hypothetical protein
MRSNPDDDERKSATETTSLDWQCQLGCFALVIQTDSQDRFVAFGDHSAPRKDG